MRFLSFLLSASLGLLATTRSEERPNILWIYVDDMSDWMGCYGHDAVETPHIDSLAREGIRFERAYMPSPVCSSTRSALITGTMQTTHGLHRHRTMIKKPLPTGVTPLPTLFLKAGYTTFNEEKEDYNFTYDRDDLFSKDFDRPKMRGHLIGRDVSFLEQLHGKPFFGQIQLKGGKFGGESGSKYPSESRVDEAKVRVPPCYPDTPVIRNAIARHYEQVVETDEQVGAILNGLKKHDLWENTIILFFTDHGSPLPRGKQFLYEDGTKVPLIVRFPSSMEAPAEPGTVRDDLVNGIDISATTLALANLPIPESVEGRDLFSQDHEPREFVISARDRCGIAVDRIRSVRTDRYRYIRNDLTDRALYQSQYRDKFATLVELREKFSEGQLTPLQASYHRAEDRPEEELYDLETDPDQVNNLANDPTCQEVLTRHRQILDKWINETGDKGQVMDSQEELRRVYEVAKGKVESPEFEFLNEAGEKKD
ncbi:MAG: sulfatase [Verrucomicrobiales bacterium]|nr:sulfatase [Verrucomicrobiales bacterium]